jgi:hypothetical protein
MQPEKYLAEALETALGKTAVNWGDVRRLCEEIDRQRKQAEIVANRLLGNKPAFKPCPNCRARGRGNPNCGTCFGTGEVLNDG